MFTQMLNAQRTADFARKEIAEKDIKFLEERVELHRLEINAINDKLIGKVSEITALNRCIMSLKSDVSKIENEWTPRIMSTGQPITKKPKP